MFTAPNLRRGRQPPQYIGRSFNQSSALNSISVTAVSGALPNDLLVAIMWGYTTGPAAVTWTGASGFTEWADQGALPSMRIATKPVTGSEPGSYSFTSSATLANGLVALLCFRNVSFDTIGAFSTLSGTGSLNALSVTSAGGILIAAYGNAENAKAYTTPAGMTAVSLSLGMAAFYQVIGAGATGVRNTTVSGTGSTNSSSALIGLKS